MKMTIDYNGLPLTIEGTPEEMRELLMLMGPNLEPQGDQPEQCFYYSIKHRNCGHYARRNLICPAINNQQACGLYE